MSHPSTDGVFADFFDGRLQKMLALEKELGLPPVDPKDDKAIEERSIMLMNELERRAFEKDPSIAESWKTGCETEDLTDVA